MAGVWLQTKEAEGGMNLIQEKEKNPHRPKFVEKIRQGDEDLKHGRGRRITLEELDSLVTSIE